MKVKRIVELFLDWCQENRKATTARHYKSRLSTFVERFGNKKFQKLKPLQIENWLVKAGRWKDGSLKAADTRRATIVAFQVLQSWAVSRGQLKKPIIEKIEKPRGNFRERIPTEEEVQAVNNAASPEFRLIYQALRQCGARPGELASAQIADWDRGNRMIVLADHKTVRRTGKPRMIGVGEKLEAMLLESINNRGEGPIFLSPQGEQWTTGTLSGTYRRLREQLGLPKDLVLYLTRHEHASKVCEECGVFAAMQSLGHSDVKTTQRYVKQDRSQLLLNQDCFQTGESCD